MTNKVLRLPEVMIQTGLSRSSIYLKIQKGEFPKQIKISDRSVGWLQAHVDDWLNQRIQLSMASVNLGKI